MTINNNKEYFYLIFFKNYTIYFFKMSGESQSLQLEHYIIFFKTFFEHV